VRYFSDAELAKAACHEGDVVITVSGNGLGKTWLVEDRAFLAASNFVRILRQKHGRAHGPFLAAALNGGDAQRLLTEHTATSAYPNLRPTFFSTRWLALPSLDEQTAIATVLSDMDAEIAALERRRDKTRAIKQGMMQQLLTGRVRLVKPEVAA
jgi:type I restriction enzyme S subunit